MQIVSWQRHKLVWRIKNNVYSFRNTVYFLAYVCLLFSAELAAEPLETLLKIDRLHFYSQRLADTIAARGNLELSGYIRKLSPEDFAKQDFSRSKLSDANGYDVLVLKTLRFKFPSFQVESSDVTWEYPFLKNKLNEGFRLVSKERTVVVGAEEVKPSLQKVPAIISDPLLETDQYIADRTTRAVFWDGILNGTPIEFHVGSTRSFMDHLEVNKAEIIGEIQTHSRNYNKAFVIQYPGEKHHRIAFTEIGGRDRLEHLKRQLDLVEWNGKTYRDRKQKVKVFGDPKEFLKNQEQRIREQMKVLPIADQVVIGQKGAFETVFESLAQLGVLAHLDLKKIPKKRLSEEEWALLDSLRNTNFPVRLALSNKSGIKWLFQKLEPEIKKQGVGIPNFKSFSIDNGTFEMTDTILKDWFGKPKRWRLISNVWGDEILPIARALHDSGNHQIAYIGTAGALPGKDLEVGDIFIPSYALDSKGVRRMLKGNYQFIPEGSRRWGTVAHVGSPFEETGPWLMRQHENSRAVELESAYLIDVFRGKKDHLDIVLLISDIVGAPGETLAHARSRDRRQSLSDVLETLLGFRLISGVADKSLVEKEKVNPIVINENRIEEALLQAGERVNDLLKGVAKQGVSVKVGLPEGLKKGTFDPKREPLEILFLTKSHSDLEKSLNLALKYQKMLSGDKVDVKIDFIRGPPDKAIKTVSHEEALSPKVFWNEYVRNVLAHGGMVAVEKRGGTFKFVEVPLAKDCKLILKKVSK